MLFLFACGGTGGHIFPALSVGEEMRRRDARTRILYVCGKKDIENAIFNVAREEKVAVIETAPFRGAFSLADPLFLSKSLRGFFQSLRMVLKERPVLVVGFGGYVSFPVIAAAKCCGIPTMIHEQNVIPGKANDLLAKHVDAVAMSFEETKKRWAALKNARVTGNPIRTFIERDCRQEALDFFRFSSGRKTLLVLGGSQGADSINTLFLACLEKLSENTRRRLQVLHLCGRMDPAESERACEKAGVPAKAFAFFDRMDLAYGAADFCVGRAGATFLAEVVTKNIPMLLVPYPFSGGHQRANAEAYRRLCGAYVVEQKDLDADKLAVYLNKMMGEKEKGAAGHPAAGRAREELAAYIEESARK